MRRLKSIAITYPDSVPDEAAWIERMLLTGAADRVHIRKPTWDATRIEALISAIPAYLRPRLSIHDHFELATALSVGIHLNRRNPLPPAGRVAVISRSCHTIDELRYRERLHDGINGSRSHELSQPNCRYYFLSPIFNSISKPGYHAAFTPGTLQRASDDGLLGDDIIALGGVRPDNLVQIENMGFGGAAFLGAAWENPAQFISAMRTDLSDNFRLQLITNGHCADDHINGARMALAGGCRWVQLRMKEAVASEILSCGRQLSDICHAHGATFLLDDHVELVKAVNADGAHIGKHDMPLSQARAILDKHYIIGVTANTFDDIAAAAKGGADYVGLGPFRFTTTKKNLSSTLGLGGYVSIMQRLHDEGITIPVVAIGGITATDVPAIMSCGVNGIAISGAILHSDDPAGATTEIINQIQNIL